MSPVSTGAPLPGGGPWDVAVIGGGNAGLAAALAARRHAGRVLIVERAQAPMRGGNTRHTRNIRCVHRQADEFTTGSYPFAELWRDLCGVGTGPGNERLAELTVRESEGVPGWMSAHGVKWQPPLAGTLHLGRTNRFFLGGGKALVNTYHRTAERMGIAVCHGTTVEDLVMAGDRCTGLLTADGVIRARAVVAASGGFEANIAWLRRYWGDAADNYLIRGPRDNDGRVLAALYAHGAARAGEERGFHAVAVDARSPRFDGGIATRLDSIPFGIVVNSAGRRFYDEGEEIWPKRYAIWGRNIAEQPGQIAYSIWDAKVARLFLPPMYAPAQADSIGALAASLGLDERARRRDRHRLQRRDQARRHVRPRGPGRLRHRRDQPAQEPLGAADRHPALLRDRHAPGHHVHLPGRRGHAAGAGPAHRRHGAAQRVRGGRDHVRQHPLHRLPGRLRPHHRHRLGPHRRGGGGAPCA